MIEPLAEAERMLADAKTVAEVKSVVDTAMDLRTFFGEVLHNRRQANAAAALWLEGMRKGGQMIIAANPRAGRPRAGNTATLAVFRIDEHKSRRWQRIARVPEDAFRGYLADGLARDDAELTAIGLDMWASGLHERARDWSRDGIPVDELETLREDAGIVTVPVEFDGDYADAGAEMHARKAAAAARPAVDLRDVVLVMKPGDYAQFQADIKVLQKRWDMNGVIATTIAAVHRAATGNLDGVDGPDDEPEAQR